MRRGNRGGFRNSTSRPQKSKQCDTTELEEINPIFQAFVNYREELDEKHDRHERIVKLSRDITIESKRIIFLLHSIDERRGNKQKVIDEAKQRLEKLISINFKAIAKELGDLDPYQYKWAFSPGLQEFIEAYTFVEFMMGDESMLSDWNAFQKKMMYMEMVPQTKVVGEKINEETKFEVTETKNVESSTNECEKIYKFFVDPTEYILGLSDLTGELMRRCINSLGSGETQTCVETCKALQRFYTGYVSLQVFRCRELSRKIHTMHQSVLKAENVCYNVKVRGGEAAKWGAVNTFDKPNDEIDEGFY